MSSTLEQWQRLVVEGFGKLPDLELRARPDGPIEFRYIVEDGDYPGFDGQWRVVSESEQLQHLRMGGQVAEWLRALNHSSLGS